MRVVAGAARGVRLDAPRGTGVRPTSDRVRESIFSILGSMGLPEDASVLDLFAGTGALGIEALSRGASTATFVDHDPVALETVRTNLARAGLADRATVVRAEAERWIHRMAGQAGSFDLALLDPPYAFERWEALLDAVSAGTVVIESDRPVALPGRHELHRQRRYGSTVVTVAVLQERPS